MRLTVLIISLLILLSCSRLPSDEGLQLDLYGDWEGFCSETTEFITSGAGGYSVTYSHKTKYTFEALNNGGLITRTELDYDSANCLDENRRSSRKFTGTYGIDETQLENSDIIDIDIVYLSLKYTAHTEEARVEFSDQFNGGLTFEINKEIDVTTYAHGESTRFYDIYAVDLTTNTEKLYLGLKTTLDATSEENRPDIVDDSEAATFKRP